MLKRPTNWIYLNFLCYISHLISKRVAIPICDVGITILGSRRCCRDWRRRRDLDGILAASRKILKIVEERRGTFPRPKVARKRSKRFSPADRLPRSSCSLARHSHWKIILAVNCTREHDHDRSHRPSALEQFTATSEYVFSNMTQDEPTKTGRKYFLSLFN